MDKINKIAVIGLGYVGLPLALLAEEKKFDVIGIDASEGRIDQLKKRISPIDDKDASVRLKKTKIKFSTDFTLVRDVDIAIICVPTPVHEDKKPDLSIVESATISTAKHLRENALLIIESTINPGVCDELLIPIIEEQTKLKVGKNLHFAHCPERINPGDQKWHVGNINRVVGANSEEALDLAYAFYSQLIDGEIKKMASLKEAEAVKIVENSFRDINIAFVNELAMSFSKLGINVVNVINGAATKPFAFMPHFPGIGVGGHCIPVDPYYLIEYAHNNGFEHRFMSLAREINENMPAYCIELVETELEKQKLGDLKGKKVTVLGLSYKPNVGDMRESPATKTIKILKEKGAEVTTFDPYFVDKSTAKSLDEALRSAEVVVLATAHKEFIDAGENIINSGAKIVMDGRNALYSQAKNINNKVYLGVGVTS
ncbi:nucleotide sugar dehydrogenase [Candidatus Berkelbacteria bacterium]|nr:nucleotide sugar dehydrogenase [Candidatus Berkelbacteria bacterium]